jgi:hypothetical protein
VRPLRLPRLQRRLANSLITVDKLTAELAKATGLKNAYMGALQKFLQGGRTSPEDFMAAHRAGLDYYDLHEKIARDTTLLAGGSTVIAWRYAFASECTSVLESLLTHYSQFVANNIGLAANQALKPSRNSYSQMQSLVARELPSDATVLRAEFAQSNLPFGGFDHPMPTRRVGHAVGYGLVAMIGIATAIYLTKAVQSAPMLRGPNGGLYFYLTLIVIALASAAFLFGAMRSTASLRGQHLGAAYELGGPAALFAMVVIGAAFLIPRPTDSFSVTIRFIRQDTNEVLAQGRVVLFIADIQRPAGISNGDAVFPGVPAAVRNERASIQLQAPGFKLYSNEPIRLDSLVTVFVVAQPTKVKNH